MGDMSDNLLDNFDSSADDDRMQQFVCLLTGNERRLKGYILTLVPNLADAEQIAQETSLRLWKQFDRYDASAGNFSAWARSIAHYQILTYRKKLGRERVTFSSELIDALAERATVREAELAARQEALIDCLQKLPDPSRQLVRLYYVVGIKLHAAAERLGRTAAATEKAIVRIRRLLYDCINTTLRKDAHP
jgi:RNA polymerase sigma-70 factor, ECF subfamily